MGRLFLNLFKSRLRAFTLLECLIALLVLAGSLSIYQGLTKVLSANIHYVANSQEENWLLFCQQFRAELERSRLKSVSPSRLTVMRDGQELAFGKSKSDDFRKTNADGRGFQPMLWEVASASFSQEDDDIRLELRFTNGLERSFIYAFTNQT